MEDAKDFSKSQRLVSDMGYPMLQTQPNPSKFYWHFLGKSVLVTVLLVILPLFPSQAPEFLNQSVLTRSWELFHLLFVGIAVSYGLFSRRNVETEKENQSKIDTAQNYVSRILQVSSVFDDDVDGQFGSDEKVQTWNSCYFRGEPMIVVEQESPVDDEQRSTVTKISNKPLLLPVRSLKSRVSDSDASEFSREPRGFSSSLSRSSSGSRSSSNGSFKTRNGDIGAVDPLDLEERLQENVVLPSPIPWRSRSGRMEMKEESEGVTPPPYSLPPSADEAEIDRDRLRFRSFRSVSWTARTNSTSPSPRKLSPSPSLSPELRAKNVEDSGRKKSYYTSCPPPPPPPPPPTYRKSPLITSNSNPVSNGYSSGNMVMKKSFKDELEDLSKSNRVDIRNKRDPSLDTLREEVKSRVHTEAMAKSVRTVRASEPNVEARKAREYSGERLEDKKGKRWKEVEAMFMTKTGRRAGGFDQWQMSTEKPSPESPCPMPKSPLSKYQIEEKKESYDKVIVEADEDSDGETEADADADYDDTQGSLDTEEAVSNTGTDAGVDSEVDKKAAEFIAKFREQIRLQRIESIKRASGKVSNRAS
ncbi:serine/arginine repetitive matrix protein 1-like isoform X2 [Macadamia integrifolia]|uniref:serine/arginine repetitive matrix protein 1-like isoform X2 n=1 Tax=Macadamia integrifolia TaxID=60698 RepID=UPI001C4EAA49|nr:serine/arginine repetitive matrix protein 1-like isoform X2 [Macadamia integrifolia]